MAAPSYCAVNYAVSAALAQDTPKVEYDDAYGGRIERTRLYDYRDLPESKLIELSTKNPSLMEYPEIKHARTRRLVSRLADVVVPKKRVSEDLVETPKNRKRVSEDLEEAPRKKRKRGHVERDAIKQISISNNNMRMQKNKSYDFLKL